MFESVALIGMADVQSFFKSVVIIAAIIFLILAVMGAVRAKQQGEIADEELIVPVLLRALFLFVAIAAVVLAV